mgnify:CR=1 FL=1
MRKKDRAKQAPALAFRARAVAVSFTILTHETVVIYYIKMQQLRAARKPLARKLLEAQGPAAKQRLFRSC